jgi:hypothetical protein
MLCLQISPAIIPHFHAVDEEIRSSNFSSSFFGKEIESFG